MADSRAQQHGDPLLAPFLLDCAEFDYGGLHVANCPLPTSPVLVITGTQTTWHGLCAPTTACGKSIRRCPVHLQDIEP